MRAFEASARHQSFSAAALELNVTPAAVGQLVRGLEEWLGVSLFLRGAGGRARLVATDVAQRALPDIRAGLDRLSLGLERLKEGAPSSLLTVTVSPAFSAKWLLPRIERFHDVPDINMRLDTSLKLLDFATQGIDIGVRYGTGTWPDLVADKLMDEDIYPVCSPRLLQARGDWHAPADLARETLIHDLSVDGRAGFATWDAWFSHAGVDGATSHRGMKINNSAAVLQAAIDGNGIALARSAMAADDIAAGRLVRLFPSLSFTSTLAYYVVYRPESATLPRLVAFRDWLCWTKPKPPSIHRPLLRRAQAVDRRDQRFHLHRLAQITVVADERGRIRMP
ncbi:Glycine cleavage system transcriptional activator GcvA [Candidatus Burkholderia verschuerenii]|uniref:Glycine cleavage system transcriptional activator GcvA n=2 Tax=Candidatus Burkholderia verschuerenii TaxID=242163 RepID=A0A0L0MHL9_9BURK|nr:Glycine cleavage system transcriptional activator GcvA [Candidatus Burkholderia verschuerenii]